MNVIVRGVSSTVALFAVVWTFDHAPLKAQDQPPARQFNTKLPGQSPDNLTMRIHHQHMRINKGLRDGTITKEQAEQLQQSLNKLSGELEVMRHSNNGVLKPEQLIQAENQLNQNNQLIKTVERAGESPIESGAVLGPGWNPGADGAQNPGPLLKQMKTEERRELRQEKQALEQKVEQQQLQYERQMVPSLGGQRTNILEQKKQVQEIRQEQGAN